MATEIARLCIASGDEAEFETAARRSVPLFGRAAGCRSMQLFRSHEERSGYWLLVEWDSVTAHEAFRTTADYAEWRALAGPFFAEAPVVEHGVDIGISTFADIGKG